MKKISTLLAMAVVFCVVSHAWAFPIKTGDKMNYKWPGTYPGTLTMTNAANDTYNAFCIQKDVYIWNGGPYTVGAVGGASLDDKTKWLYAAFYEDTFKNVSESDLSGFNKSLGYAVQNAIWYTRGVDNSLTKKGWNLLSTYWTETSTGNSWDDFSNDWDIRSIELSKANGTPVQTQIVGVNPSAVPEPGTMVLLGLGLMGVAGVVKRRKN